MAYAPNITDTVDSAAACTAPAAAGKNRTAAAAASRRRGTRSTAPARSRRAARTGALPTVANARNCLAGCSRTIPVTRVRR